ncbi:hypothetical protein Lal_00031596 [Lupinus albus]|uniref:Uncharacterized protein n=1 Tax=Lupinus albus TaxID=3870 RepID=A0A6A5P3D4_LUPAL|nr:hypothetical protein Lalb_Chr18g0048831 [Lupinus albus]KAF1891787.1 hypothetical protein Lal_00031596 [Lupinus albus]
MNFVTLRKEHSSALATLFSTASRHCFLKAVGIGAVQVVACDAHFTAFECTGVDGSGGIQLETSYVKKHGFLDLRDSYCSKYLTMESFHVTNNPNNNPFLFHLQTSLQEAPSTSSLVSIRLLMLLS